jgi:hypothetical protein
MSEQTLTLEEERADQALRLERRANIRYACEQMTFCRSLSVPRERFWTAVVRDLSASGIGLLVRSSFELGTILAIELQGLRSARTLLGRVIHARPQASGGWIIGCELASNLSDAELHTLQ